MRNWHVKKGYDPADKRRVHVYPGAVDLPDIFHETKGPCVDAPFGDCALCAVGLCVQRIGSEPNLIIHARSVDA